MVNSSPLFVDAVPIAALVPAHADQFRESRNFDDRPMYVRGISCIVLHATADEGNEDAAESWLCHPDSQASAHLHIRRDGTIVRLVGDHFRAWHAGESLWKGALHVNDFSLGWEIANRNDGERFTPAQYSALAQLGTHYVSQGLPLSAFVSHAEVAMPKGRKTDPAGFDWMAFKVQVLRRYSEQ